MPTANITDDTPRMITECQHVNYGVGFYTQNPEAETRVPPSGGNTRKNNWQPLTDIQERKKIAETCLGWNRFRQELFPVPAKGIPRLWSEIEEEKFQLQRKGESSV